MRCLQELLLDVLHINVCEYCLQLFFESKEVVATTNAQSSCSLCMGILHDKFICSIFDQIEQSFLPYGGFDQNIISKNAPTIVIPIQTVIRAQCSLLAIRNANIEDLGISEFSSSQIYAKIKDSIRSKVRSRLKEKCPSMEFKNNFLIEVVDSTRNILLNEEMGFMNCHVIILAPQNTPLPTNIIRLPQSIKKRERKRFRGKDPINKQGGDPRVNLEKRLRAEGKCKLAEASNVWAEDNFQKSVIFNALDDAIKIGRTKDELTQWISQKQHYETNSVCVAHIASWRQPIYLQGRYTKCARNISQSPFFVSCEDENQGNVTTNINRMKRLGITSVEEEITPIVSKLAFGGISSQNNETCQDPNGSNIVFGMTKFHASGREDMDVRMILPIHSFHAEKAMVETDNDTKDIASGRPFVLEAIDAYRVPKKAALDEACCVINHVSNRKDTILFGVTEAGSSTWVKEKDRKHVQYGANPSGVGISDLNFCQASCFSKLQSETEHKVKFYSCLCWSEKPNDVSFLEKVCPLEISQSTPLRVLHRRSKAVRIRHILSLQTTKIDDHWFRLDMSTSAGTYVKEFCNGDLGRTIPSISSLLECKVDIVELDCKGISAT